MLLRKGRRKTNGIVNAATALDFRCLEFDKQADDTVISFRPMSSSWVRSSFHSHLLDVLIFAGVGEFIQTVYGCVISMKFEKRKRETYRRERERERES